MSPQITTHSPYASPHPFLSKLVWVGFQLFATKESSLTPLPDHSEKKWGLEREGVGGDYKRTRTSLKVPRKWPSAGRCPWSQKLHRLCCFQKHQPEIPKPRRIKRTTRESPIQNSVLLSGHILTGSWIMTPFPSTETPTRPGRKQVDYVWMAQVKDHRYIRWISHRCL